jgi:hypothetical protein
MVRLQALESLTWFRLKWFSLKWFRLKWFSLCFFHTVRYVFQTL